MKKKRKCLRWLILLIVIAAVAGGLFLRKGDGTVYSETQAERGDIRTTYSFTGSIVAPYTQTVAVTAPVKVKELYVESNQQVEKGDRLAALSDGQIIRADLDGEIISLPVHKEDTLAAGQTIMVIADVDRMEVEISVDEYDVDAIELGKNVTATVNALEISCPGRVKSFEKQARTIGTMAAYAARIELDTPEKALPGMQVEVEMLKQASENTILLKMDALQFDDKNRAYVLTKDSKGEYITTYVETGITDGTQVEILSGLKEGDTVYYAAGLDMFELMQEMRGRMKQ